MSKNGGFTLEIKKLLKENLLFGSLGEEDINELSKVAFIRKVPRGTIIFRRGDNANSMYIVKSGAVSEFAGGANDLEIVVKVRRKGDFFGEMGMLLDEPHVVTAISLQPTILIGLYKEDFLRCLWKEQSLVKSLLKIMAKRLKLSGERQITYALLGAESRLANIVLWMETEEGGKGYISVTQEYIAQCCGLARQTVARILGKWRENGYIKTGRGKLHILNKDAIFQLVIDDLE